MCGEPLGFTTIVGARIAIEGMQADWDSLGLAERDLPRPRIIEYSLLENSDRFSESYSPAVAVVDHSWSTEPDIAHLLQATAAAHQHSVVCEPGYGFSLAGAHHGTHQSS